ncbi:BAG family molecular chaperone regulator 6, partial [Mucuna pruriens]
MMPAYRSMDSYPYQRNQIPFPHYFHPGIEAIPPQMKVDPSKPPFSYDQSWPYAGHFGHPIPPHFCFGHNNNDFPCYYHNMPSYPHAPSPMYYYGACPAYNEPYFVPYSPQPHYAMELPRFEYGKSMPRGHHCCGCPNHPCNQKEGASVKIEDHEPDGGHGNKVNDALVPIQLKNYPYPFVWIPPEYTSNKQLKNPNTMEEGEQNKISHDRKPPGLENSNGDAQPAQEPRVWNGWFPLKGASNMSHDGYGIRNQKQESENNRRESEDGKIDQNQKHQNEHKRSEFPFPIFWLPYYNKQEESGKANNQENTSPKIIEEVPHAIKSVPVKSRVDEGGANGTLSNEAEYTNTGAADVVEKVTNARSIPVKQIKLHQGKNDSKENQMEENVTKKESCTGDRKRQSTSSPKGSKLPPVCLRVDPLPRKKSGNGSSRSPSPPKEYSQATAGETFKTPVCGTNDKAQPNLNNENAPNTSENVKPKEKTIQVSEYKASENKGVDIPSQGSKGTRKTCTNSDEYNTEDKKEKKGAENMIEESTELREVKDSSTLTDAGPKEGRVLSDADAAVLIQAAYRGYQVRKWEPLKKLKQIDEVRKEVTDVRGRVQAFERSSDLQNDDKQKIAIGEIIMRLLLKLDTIQGLQPSFREIRKSLARELTILQERLDSIMAKKPQQQMQDFVVQKYVEVTPKNTPNEERAQNQQEEKVVVPGDSSEGITDDVKCPSANDGGSESQSLAGLASNEGTKPVVILNGLDNGDTRQVVTADALNSVSDLSEDNKTAVEPKANDIPIEVTVWEELPVGIIDEDERDNEMNISKEAQTENEIFIEELPVGILDEDTAKSEVKKHDEAKTYEEVLLAQEGEGNDADEQTSSSTYDRAKETRLEQQQQQLEEQEEVQSSGESDGWVEIEFQKEGELKGDAPKEVGNDSKSSEDVCLEANDVNSISPEPLEFMPINNIQKEEEPEEKIVERETQEMVAETLAQEKTELSSASPPVNGDSKLLEENEKLRKMMKKLLEAGNEQLSVISDLSGRVKDLEKKLARSRSKRVKTKRYKPPTYKMSCMK